MDAPAQFALGVVRVHRWTPGCSHYSLTDTLYRDEVDWFRCDDHVSALTKDDMLLCGQMLIASLRSTQAAPTLRAPGTSTATATAITGMSTKIEFDIDCEEVEDDDEDEEEEEEIFNREIDAVEFRDWTHTGAARTSSSAGGATTKTATRDEDGIFFHLPKDHPKFLTLQGVGVPDPRFKRTFYVQQEVCFLVLLSNVPFQAYLKEKMQDLAHQFFAQNNSDGVLANYDTLEAFYAKMVSCSSSSTSGGVDFHALPFRELYVGLPVVNLVKWLGKDVIAILRVILLEGRVMCYSNHPGLASAATLALLALLPGALSVNAEFTSKTIQAVVYRLRRYGMPFSLFNEDFVWQPCFTRDQLDAVYTNTAGFLVGASDPLLSKQPQAKLDLIVDLDNRQLVALPTLKSEYAFGFGAATAAFGDSLAGRFGRNLASSTTLPSPSVSRVGSFSRAARTSSLGKAARTASGRLAQSMGLPRRKSGRLASPVEPAAQSDVEWVLAQFQSYFEHFVDEGGKGLFHNHGASSSGDVSASASSGSGNGYDPYTPPSVLSRIEDLAAPMVGEHAKFYGEYGRAWVHAWQKTNTFENWVSAHRLERRRRLTITSGGNATNSSAVPPPPQEGRVAYTYANGDEYDGEFHRGRRHGFGIYVEFMTKNQYEGDWLDDTRHGKGILSSKMNGYIYDGEWRCDVRCGRGHSSLKNVENYAGEWLDNRFHGMGVYSNARGDVYDGEWQRGLKHGMGKLVTGSDALATTSSHEEFGGLKQFVGEWRGGRFHGTGTAQYVDGTQYSGCFQDGKRHGNGLLLYANGDKYDGQWWKGFRHGEGCHFSATSGATKEGTWRKDAQVDGTWFITYPNHDKFTGECQRGRPWGQGICKYANGSSYSGEWVDGLREGFGVLVNVDGTILEGEWANSVFVKAVRPPSRFVDISLAPSGTATAMAGAGGSPRRLSSSTTATITKPPASGSHLFTYVNGDQYEGEFKNHLRCGFGVFTERATGSVYEGEWHNDQRHGSGVLTSGMKDFIYDGTWQHDVRTGYGHCVIRGCETYSGDWRDNQFHGTGKYIDAEGNVYDGEFANGKKHGVGKQVFTLQKEEYSGEWRHGRREGTGDATFADGSTYSGHWRHDVQDGEGTFTQSHVAAIGGNGHGDRYTGQWRQGVRDGAGVLYQPSTGVTKEGTWVNDQPVDGEWTILFPDGSKFTGECVKGRPHGRGVCKYASGDLFDGQWVNGQRHGHGIGFFTNGDSFIGDWENNHVALNGKGKLTLADGTVHVYAQ